MRKFYFEIKEGQQGLLNDGRRYEVISVPSITMCSDGTLKYGDVRLSIDEIPCTVRISEFVERVKTIGNLTIERGDKKEDGKQELTGLSAMTERQKEAHVQGVEFVIDYGYLPEKEDYQLYLAILEERKEKDEAER